LGTFFYETTSLLRKERVAVRKLDDLAAERQLRRLDVLKLDVEGAEFWCLEGARTILETMRPVVLFEFSDNALRTQGASGEQLLELLRSLSYCIYTFDEETGQPAPVVGQGFSGNLVAAPAEKRLPIPDWQL